MPEPNWIVIFDDAEMGNAVFENESEARDFFERVKHNWNCYLYQLVERG